MKTGERRNLSRDTPLWKDGICRRDMKVSATYALPIRILADLVFAVSLLFYGGPSRTRTCDPLIMSLRKMTLQYTS